MQQQTQRVDENVTLLAFDQLARIKPMGVNLCPTFFPHVGTNDSTAPFVMFKFKLPKHVATVTVGSKPHADSQTTGTSPTS